MQSGKNTEEINGRLLVDIINDLSILPKNTFDTLVVMIHALAEKERKIHPEEK